MPRTSHTKYTHAEWRAEAIRRFGEDEMKWKFVCPSCGCVWSMQDWKDAGAKSSAVASQCVGRYKESPNDIGHDDGVPCNYANFGLFCFDPVTVVMDNGKETTSFGFLETPEELDAVWAELDDEERAALAGFIVTKPPPPQRAVYERLCARELFSKRYRHKKGPVYTRRSLGNRIAERQKRKSYTQQPQQESHV